MVGVHVVGVDHFLDDLRDVPDLENLLQNPYAVYPPAISSFEGAFTCSWPVMAPPGAMCPEDSRSWAMLSFLLVPFWGWKVSSRLPR